jgi:hypothetical protein
MNFTDVRAEVNVTNTVTGEQIDNATILTNPKNNWHTGYNLVLNDTATREIHLIINGRDP